MFNANQVMASDNFDWMSTDLKLLGGLFQCKEVPESLKNFKQFHISLDLAKPGIWQATGQRVQKQKAIKFYHTFLFIIRSNKSNLGKK